MAQRERKTTPSPMPDREILNIDGAAAFLGVSIKTFSKVLRDGDVPGRKVGREWKFSRQALIDWVGSRTSRDFLDAGDEALGDEAAPGPRRAAGAPPAAGKAGARRASGPRRKDD
ncbi:MAG: helix-turn-helix domain-containing protein, partial [Planctomycetes bacterium]|nr:helix-turn-helix domain-containing protein [Planctomycetota bacterium]